MRDLKHFIFDFSGTLFDDHKVSFLATQRVIEKFSGKSITYEAYKNDFTIPVHAFYYQYIGPEVDVPTIDKAYFECFAEVMHEGELFAGVRESFQEICAQGKTISLFSTVKQEMLEERVQALGLSEYVSDIHGSVFHKVEEFGAHLERVNWDPHEVLYVGDMDHDVHAAQENGMVSGAVLSGYHNVDRLLAAEPDLVWQSPSDWPAFFKSLREPRAPKDHTGQVYSTVGGLVFNPQGEALFILTDKWNYTYGTPGGKIDYGEDATQAFVRELREEAGLDVSDVELVLTQECVCSEEFYIPNGHYVMLNYTAKTDSTEVVLNDEAQSYLWLKPEQALRLKLNTPTRKLVEQVLAR